MFFLVAAFLPVSKVYTEPSPEKKLEIITNMRAMWNTSSVLFGLGSLIMVTGLGFFTLRFNDTGKAALSYAGIILLGIGALLWTWHVTERIIHPEGFTGGTNTPYLFAIYSVLTQAGLFLIGLFLLNTVVPDWVAWMLMIASVALFILMVIFRDMPPFVYYLLTIIMAITMMVNLKALSQG